MSAAIESPTIDAGSARAEAPSAKQLSRLMSVAGELAGRTVLAVGSAHLASLLREAGAGEVGTSEAAVEETEVESHAGRFPQLTFTKAYDVVLVAAGFEAEKDALPRIARACGAARQEVLAYFPKPRRSWLGRRKRSEGDEAVHEPAWVKRLFEMAGASSCERIKAPDGYIIRARFQD
jgi:hypothetical protein